MEPPAKDKDLDEVETVESWVRSLDLCWSMKKVFTQKWKSLPLGTLETYRGLKIRY